jgi:hypothetical protein
MRRFLKVGWLATVLGSAVLFGCHRPAVREKPLPDPLLTSRKPVEGRSYTLNCQPHCRDNIPLPPPPPRDPGTLVSTPNASVVQMLAGSER